MHILHLGHHPSPQVLRHHLDSDDMARYKLRRIISSVAAARLCWRWSAVARLTGYLLGQSAGPEPVSSDHQVWLCLCFMFATRQKVLAAVNRPVTWLSADLASRNHGNY